MNEWDEVWSADESAQSQVSEPSGLDADVLPVVPMRNVVLFPHIMTPLTLGRPKSLAALEFCLHHKIAFEIGRASCRERVFRTV